MTGGPVAPRPEGKIFPRGAKFPQGFPPRLGYLQGYRVQHFGPPIPTTLPRPLGSRDARSSLRALSFNTQHRRRACLGPKHPPGVNAVKLRLGGAGQASPIPPAAGLTVHGRENRLAPFPRSTDRRKQRGVAEACRNRPSHPPRWALAPPWLPCGHSLHVLVSPGGRIGHGRHAPLPPATCWLSRPHPKSTIGLRTGRPSSASRLGAAIVEGAGTVAKHVAPV